MTIYFIFELQISLHNIYLYEIQSVTIQTSNTMSHRLTDCIFTEVKEYNIMIYSLILPLKLSQLQPHIQ